MNIPLRFTQLAKGASQPVALVPSADYLFMVPPDSAAEAALGGSIRSSHRAVDVSVIAGPLSAFAAVLSRYLVSIGLPARSIPISQRQAAHLFVLARLPNSSRTLNEAIASFYSNPGPIHIGGRN